MIPAAFLRWSGRCLMLGGFLTLAVNLFLTPFAHPEAPFAARAASALFLWRQGGSCLAVALLLAGSTGLHLRQVEAVGRTGAIVFAIAWLGTAMTLAFEWAELFLVHTLALRAPQALQALDSGRGPSAYDLASAVAAATFLLGWLGLGIVTWRAAILPRAAAIAVVAGLVCIPALRPLLPSPWGPVIGNVVLGGGWIGLGAALQRAAP